MSELTKESMTCVRCRLETAALPAAPLPGPTGEEIRQKICENCWEEWQRAEVMVINELRLNFMDPRSLEILEHHMREFLLLAPAGENAGGGDRGPGPEAPGS